MKLATFRDGTRDGALAVVARDLSKAVTANAAIAGLNTLQQLLDDWQDTRLGVERIYAELNEVVEGKRPAPFPIVDFEQDRCAAPLPGRLSVPGRSAHVEALLEAKPRTPFLKFGDRVRIEMLDAAGRSIFGAIDQQVVKSAR